MSAARDAPWRGMAAIAVLAYAACDLLHEAAHVAAAWLPVGVRSVTISTVGVSSFGESAIVSLAGPLANLVLGSTLWLMRSHALPATARYATWLFGVILVATFSVVRHADALAEILGEPLGTLVLTLSVITIEVLMVASVMLTGDANPELGRDTM